MTTTICRSFICEICYMTIFDNVDCMKSPCYILFIFDFLIQLFVYVYLHTINEDRRVPLQNG